MTTRPIKSDPRWTIDAEYTGHISGKPQYVIRFCGDWIDSRSTMSAAILRAVGAKNARDGALIVTEARP